MKPHLTTFLACCILAAVSTIAAAADAKPNVILLLTDDQGFGELGAMGNPLVRTPHIDRFVAQAASLTNFHVMPVCSPTRACLMTGRYNYRTGVVNTFLGVARSCTRTRGGVEGSSCGSLPRFFHHRVHSKTSISEDINRQDNVPVFDFEHSLLPAHHARILSRICQASTGNGLKAA